MLKKYKAVLAIVLGFTLFQVILTFSNRVTTPNKHNPYFSYEKGANRNSLIHVNVNKRVEVPIVFDIGEKASEISLEFSVEHDEIPGLTITENFVAAVNGKAISKVIIQFDSKPTLKAGTHLLRVVASDKATGKIIRRGEIQLAYNMHEVIGKCPC
ncbi:MAG: hypothetical protein JSV73_03855 [Flavobacteriaceae bacterium]|nr:MAG: hypothetical protein JSV73_03855 [Flavobacteriaceae bacterium]